MKKFLKAILPIIGERIIEELKLDTIVIKRVTRNPDGTVTRIFVKQTSPKMWIWVNNPEVATEYELMEALLLTVSLRDANKENNVSFRFGKKENEVKYFKKKNA
jgi:hypothetical protein